MSKSDGGLAGVVAGETAVSTVGKSGAGLTYRGYAIEELAERASFEECAYLLIHGALPAAGALAAYRRRLAARRALSPAARAMLELLPAGCHPMDVLRSACSFIGATRLLAMPPPATPPRSASRPIRCSPCCRGRCCISTPSRPAANGWRPTPASPPWRRTSCTCCTDQAVPAPSRSRPWMRR